MIAQENNRDNDIVIICGNHTNAHTIARNLEAIGFSGDVVIVRNYNDPILLADRLNPKIEKWILSADEIKHFPEIVAERVRKYENAYVCFTNERYHRLFADWKSTHSKDNIVVHFGNIKKLPVILDRYRLYCFIQENQLGTVPHTVPGEENPFEIFGENFVVRPKESWQSPTHREYVKIVRGREEFRKVIDDFNTRGVGLNKICFQELLPIQNELSIAVGGWFDFHNRDLFCLRKRFQHPPGVGSGDVCEIIDPPKDIIKTTEGILSALEYEGPFELEFVFDTREDKYKIIELNPRFWMQHGIIEQVSGYALLSRYLNRAPLPIDSEQEKKKYWVNTVQCLYRAIKFNIEPLRYYFRRDSWAPYSLWQAMWYAPLHVLSKMRVAK